MFSDTVVILAAGKGSRMGGDIPKVLLPVAGKPVLNHVIDFWSKQGIVKFIFVIGYKAFMVTKYIEVDMGLQNCGYAVQYEQNGIAHAIKQVKNMVPDNFIVVLGDVIQSGHFDYPAHFEVGYGAWYKPYLKYLNIGCSVRVDWKGRIAALKEKGDVVYPGMGTYFFDRRVFDYIEKVNPSTLRNEVEITDVMNSMINDGVPLMAVPFYGDCVNITTKTDIEDAEKILSRG